MDIRELALITFSILTQMAVGSFIVLGVVHFFAQRSQGLEQADRMSDLALYAIGPVLGLALVASLFHLGSPLNSYRAIVNVGTSWLSREILCAVLFFGVGAVFAGLQWKKMATPALRNLVAIVAALIGIALVYSMSQIYSMRTVPSWNSIATPISFGVTALLLGTLAMGVAFVANYNYVQRKNPGCADAQCTLLRVTSRWLAVSAAILMGIELVVIPLNGAYLASQGGAALTSATMMITQFGLVYALRLALVFAGAGILGIFIYQTAQTAGREARLTTLTYAAFALLFVGEVLGRFLFYSTYVRVGVLQ
jgi:anaerobic dimethyl sulfoxide reductase subunit C